MSEKIYSQDEFDDTLNEYTKQMRKQERELRKELKAAQEQARVLREACEFTQRTDVIIGHSSDSEDGKWRGMPDKIMMRNKCKEALRKAEEIGKSYQTQKGVV